MGKQFPDYSDDLWGITASDSEHDGYIAWGGPPAPGPIDGTVVPSAAGGSLPFLPAATMRVLKTIRKRYPLAWSKYGFVNAFNPLKNWYDSDVIWGEMDDEDRKLTETVSGYWTRFAATGDPNGLGASHWPAYETKTDLCLEIGHVVEPRPVPHTDKYEVIQKSLRERLAKLQP